MEDIGKKFIEYTKYNYRKVSDQEKGKKQPPLVEAVESKYKIFELPQPETIDINGYPLSKAINERVSIRKYSEKKMDLKEFSWFLWTTQGVKEVTKRPITLRTVPSAGARHPFETYILVNNVENLEKGVYKFLPIKHKLALIFDNDLSEKITEASLGQKMVKNSSITFIWVANKERVYWRYGERGYRYIFLDAGHICQNLYLAAEPINFGVCAIAAFDDDKINNILNIDGDENFVVYMATVGKKI